MTTSGHDSSASRQPAGSEGSQKAYYDQYVLAMSGVNNARTLQRVAAVRKMLGQRRGTLLSVGAGNLSEALAFREAGFDVHIVDIADTMFDKARQLGIVPHQVDLDRQDIDGRFDVVCCLEVLEHLVDPLTALRRVAAAVAPGGRLFVSLPDEFHLVSRLKILLGRPAFSAHDWHHLRLFNRRSAAALFAAAGLRILRQRHMPLMPPRWRVLAPLGAALAAVAPNLFALSHVYELTA